MRYLWWTFLPSLIFLLAPGSSTRRSALQVPKDSTAIIGKRVFISTCYACHKDSGASLAPGPGILSSMTPRAVLSALQTGKMRLQAAALSEKEKKAVAQYVSQRELKDNPIPKTAFTKFSLPAGKVSPVFSGWGGNLASTSFRNTAQAGISAENVQTLKLEWAFAFPDATIIRSKPAVVGEWLIVGAQYGELFAINKKTGKLGWQFEGTAAVRGAVVTEVYGDAITAYFADYATNTYAVNVRTGKLIWSHRAGFDPQSSTTGSVAVYNGIVYVPISSLEVSLATTGTYLCCKSSGGLVALNARTGAEIWKYRAIAEAGTKSSVGKKGQHFVGPSGAPVWCSPTIDAVRGRVYIGTGENYSLPYTNTSDAIQALDLKTGKVLWSYQATTHDAYNSACPFFNNCPDIAGPDLDFGMAPMLVKRKNGKSLLIAGQKSGVVHAIDPDNGKIVWQQRIGKGGALGGIHWGMAADAQYVYAANADNFYALNKSDSTRKASPGLYALEIETGKQVWSTPAPPCDKGNNCPPAANSAAPTVVPGLVFAGTLDGHVRAYAASDGRIVWDFNTAISYDGVNGIKGKGGSLDGPSPVVSDGMLFVNSGYGMFGQWPGNVLLAFSTQKK